MSITARDRKILLAIVPIALAVAFYFFLLAPKREEARKAGEQLAAQQERRDQAVAKLEQATRTQTDFASAYAEMVRLGKAIPTEVDTPSLVVQLDRAARGTDIEFRSVKAGEGSSGATPASSSGGGSGSGGQGSGGGSGQSGGEGGTPEGGGADGSGEGGAAGGGGAGGTPGGDTSSSPGAGASGGASAPGLEKVPLDFKFSGTYFDLASFFHRMKRFVSVDGERIRVQGRLMTLDSLKLTYEGESGEDLVAEIKATVYLSPSSEGAAAGATPGGPATAPASDASGSASSTTPSDGSTTP